MKHTEIEVLLERYYNGESSDLEEAQLLAFFKHEEMPDHLEIDKTLFLSMKELSSSLEIDVPVNLEEDISTLIDDVPSEKKRFSVKLRWVGSVAASLVISLFIGYQMKKSDTEKALMAQIEVQRQIEDALILVSTKLNSGMSELANADSKMTSSIKIVHNSFKFVKR